MLRYGVGEMVKVAVALLVCWLDWNVRSTNGIHMIVF